MAMTGVGVAFVQETKMVNITFATCSFEEYSILAAAADSKRRGGVALLVKDREGFRVENEKVVGPNVISFELITSGDEGEGERWYVVKCHLPPPLTKRGRHSKGYCRL